MGTTSCFVRSVIRLDQMVSCLATVNFASRSRYQLGPRPRVSNNCNRIIELHLEYRYVSVKLIYSCKQVSVCIFLQIAAIIFVICNNEFY